MTIHWCGTGLSAIPGLRALDDQPGETDRSGAPEAGRAGATPLPAVDEEETAPEDESDLSETEPSA